MIQKFRIVAIVVSFTLIFLSIPTITIKERQLPYKPTEILSILTAKPVTEEVIVDNPILPQPVVIPPKVIPTLNILVSFYTSSVQNCGNSKGISASGKNLNTISRGGSSISCAAPSSVEFGTQIQVDGLGICTVEDRGGAIKWIQINGIQYMKLDVFVPHATQKQLMKKGIIKTTGRIIK